MNLVYFVHGSERTYYQQVYFSILTALKHKDPLDRIVVVTQYPAYFKGLQDQIQTLVLNKSTLESYLGPYGFSWRVKIKSIQEVARMYPKESLLYFDGDTYVFEDLYKLKESLDTGRNYMHILEGKLCELTTKTEKTMWSQLRGKNLQGITIDQESAMWNAGVIGISKDHLHSIDLALSLTDQMCDLGVTRRLIEQFSFSIALCSLGELQSAAPYIGHYWGNKEQWNQLITDFICKAFMQGLTLKEVLDSLDTKALKAYPVAVRNSSTQRKLLKTIAYLYQNKKPVFNPF